jgi:2-polyprenyl-6-methoxyphenol hydroxylase-like FAD-dependent oxidoreductase
MGFLDRRMLLQVLFDGIHDKSKIFLSREVLKIENLDEFAQVTLTDGTVISGDIVVGADGVHSRVRTEMWRIWDVDMNYNSARAKQCTIF